MVLHIFIFFNFCNQIIESIKCHCLKVSCGYHVSNCCLTCITHVCKCDKERNRHTRTYWNRNKNRKKMAASKKFQYSIHGSIRNSYVPPTHFRTNTPSMHHTYILQLTHTLWTDIPLTQKPNILASFVEYCMNYYTADTKTRISPVWRNQCVNYVCFALFSVSVTRCARAIFLCHSYNL